MKTRKRKLNKQVIMLFLMMLPGSIYLIINNYISMAGISLAFKKYDYSKGMLDSPWCGFSNFTYLFKTKDAFLMIRNTILYNLVFIVLGTVMAVAIAVMLNEIRSKMAKKVYQTGILIPYLISMVVVSYIVFAFLSADNGLINSIFMKDEKVNWYAQKAIWPFVLTIVYLWKNFGYMSIIYYASIIGIDQSIYEAATVDGATKWQRIRHVTLPGIKITVITMVLLSIGKIFRSDFGLFYQVPQNSGILSDITTTIDVYVYNALTQLNDVGRASAAGFIQAICGFILVLAANHVIRKIDEESALF